MPQSCLGSLHRAPAAALNMQATASYQTDRESACYGDAATTAAAVLYARLDRC